jgi:2-dehydropantoate 2-reductase
MSEVRDIAVLGAGAVGSVYGSMLHAAYPDRVRFLADADRVQRLRRNGLMVNGTAYAVRAATPGELESPPDLILVAVKYHHLPAAIELIEAARDEHTVVLSVLNGIDSEEIIAGYIGWDDVLLGMALAIDAVRTDTEVKCSTSGTIYLGRPRNPTVDNTVAAVRDVLQTAGI